MVVVAALFCILSQFSASVASAASSNPDPGPTPSPSVGSARVRIRPSQIRGKPMPKPAPKKPRVRGVKTQPKNSDPIVLSPKASISPKPVVPPTTFELSKSSKPGKLVVQFKANDTNLDFDKRAPFVIEFVTSGALKLTPTIITRSDWPKSGPQQVELSYQGANPAADNVILGKAAYTVCVRRTKECRKQKVPLVFHFQ